MDGEELYLVKNLARLFWKTSYAGNNSLFLKHPALYHLAIYGALKQLQVSKVLEDLMKLYFVDLDLPDLNDGVEDEIVQTLKS